MAQTTATERDAQHLRRAIELASGARGHTSPNPLVGAVVVKGGAVIGEGFHTGAGNPHAEREALAACSEDPAGATMYVSLEPCAHTGRTPPCTEAIAAARIARVVAASDDPTAKASGRGFAFLRDEGIEVEMADGEIAAAARLLNQPFRKHAATGRPLVVMKTAMTLDGKVATAKGDSKWISGDASRARGHRWRAEMDAVAVGLGTALADDPQLTSRVEGVSRQPRRVVFDSEARLPLDSNLMRTADQTSVIVICSRAAKRRRISALEEAGAEVISATGQNEGARVAVALDELGARQIQSLLLEGGPHLAGAFFDAGEIDELRAFIAPKVAGGRTAHSPVEGMGVEKIADAMSAVTLDCEPVEDDVLLTARVKEW
ncbi:MAG: bifunctional diaminohydroxyphosphoribosylaminopyrimidine deaminase/5-amino-6-(5-phosphoribosylamino)uracil reductase RibD [Thermoleophilaceae bacterium]|nr:bifunctional diaminohydroxyphosphoribosylaminopyrimidine deaminase/5-amino-6-(5-phosphoribosylamino)uracil reductase RibD [Thermoleophilaceae bacterium]